MPFPKFFNAQYVCYDNMINLEIDSTKKVCRKLQYVGNEYGEILISVLTESEGHLGLKLLADGLVERLANEGV